MPAHLAAADSWLLPDVASGSDAPEQGPQRNSRPCMC